MKTPLQISHWMKQTIEAFVNELSLSKSPLTVEAYKYDVSMFLEYLNTKKIKKLSALKPIHIVSYLGYCKSGGKSDASINRYYMAIRLYCRFLRRNKLIGFDLTEDIAPPKNNQKAPRVPTVEEIERILAQPDTKTDKGIRDRAILELLYSSGLRASELCSIKLQDEAGKQIRITCGKRSKTRTIPITESAKHWIARYLKVRRFEDGYLFQSPNRKQLTRQTLCRMVNTYAKKAGVEGVTPHTLRHACATHLLDQGADIRLIQEVLGHSSIASTQRYTHLSSRKMQEMFQQFHPRKKTEE